MALYRLASLLDPADFYDLDELGRRLEKRDLSRDFIDEWDAFVARFGARGPHEMDVASPRYADEPGIALEQMASMATGAAGFDPEAAHRRSVAERHEAYRDLQGRVGWLRRLVLRRIHLLIELFAGTRDTPKHHIVMVTHAVRRRALIEGRRLVEEGRLDRPCDVFHLRLADLSEAERDASLDLRARCADRMRFTEQVLGRVRQFPQVFDSRGRILRPPARSAGHGELIGAAVSPGTARGPVKVLNNPREKPVEDGDILVAYTTDPGWTPLFVNVAAVVLEVGGVLQHGAVVAREYGKPCVAGIDRVVTRLRDGEMVEVDGSAGVVRRLEPDR